MFKTQSYDIHASFLVPAYNLPTGVLSHYITTQKGENHHGKIAIDVWLVNASREQPKESMIASLRKEESNYNADLEKAVAEGEQTNNREKTIKIHQLKHGQKVFSQLVKEANNTVFHKTPDAEFMKIAENNLRYGTFAQYQPDLKNYLYLAGLSRYEER